MESYALAAFRSRQAVLRFEDELRRAGVHWAAGYPCGLTASLCPLRFKFTGRVRAPLET